MTAPNSYGVLIDTPGTKNFDQAFTVKELNSGDFLIQTHVRDVTKHSNQITKKDLQLLRSNSYKTSLQSFYTIQNKLTNQPSTYLDDVLTFEFTANDNFQFNNFKVYRSHLNGTIKYKDNQTAHKLKDPHHIHLADANKLSLNFIKHVKYAQLNKREPEIYPMHNIALLGRLIYNGLLKLPCPTAKDIERFNINTDETKPQYRQRKREFIKNLIQKDFIAVPENLKECFNQNKTLSIRHYSKDDRKKINYQIDDLVTGQEILTGNQLNGFIMEITNIAADTYFGKNHAAIRRDTNTSIERVYNNKEVIDRKITKNSCYSAYKKEGDMAHYNKGYAKITSGARDSISTINLHILAGIAFSKEQIFTNDDVEIMTKLLNSTQHNKFKNYNFN